MSEALNSLLDAYQQIGEQIPQLLQYQELFVSSPHMGTILAMIYQDILEFHREALKYFKQRSIIALSSQNSEFCTDNLPSVEKAFPSDLERLQFEDTRVD
jgi:hypothetical protein